MRNGKKVREGEDDIVNSEKGSEWIEEKGGKRIKVWARMLPSVLSLR